MLARPRPRAIWLPLVLAGSLLYWMLALGLSGISLTLLTGGGDVDDLALPGTSGVLVGIHHPTEPPPCTTLDDCDCLEGKACDVADAISVTPQEAIMVRLQSWDELRASGQTHDSPALPGVPGRNTGIGGQAGQNAGQDQATPPPQDPIGRTAY